MRKHISGNNDGQLPARADGWSNPLTPAILPDGNGGFTACPELLTEEELIAFLRIPQVSNAENYHNVIENLKRLRRLPRIHICNKTLYPRKAIEKWIEQETTSEE